MATHTLPACEDLLTFIDSSPTPFHAADATIERLGAAGFGPLLPSASWSELRPGRYYTPVGDGAVIAFIIPQSPRIRGFRLVGAHTDSPNLRLKPKPVLEKHGYVQLGVEVYGGVLLNSWLDRDLALAGRVIVRQSDGQLARRLVRLPKPLVRVPQLAIHLDREVNEKGLILNRQDHLVPIVGLSSSLGKRGGDKDKAMSELALINELCAQQLGVSESAIVKTELMLHDTVPSTRAGLDGELLLAPRLDNLGMCHAAILGLIRAAEKLDGDAGLVPLIALFDHEEVGSNTAFGAQAPILPTILERVVLGTGGTRDQYHQALAGSLCVSADMAHAVHPNYPDRHEANHRPVLNGGPVIKANAQQRYATCARTAALFQEHCRAASVPVQQYAHRTDLACGTTIGPLTATQLGIPTVDVGSPMLSMHSIRELCGSEDPELMTRVLTQFLTSPLYV